MHVATFHGLCLTWLRRKAPDLKVIGPETRKRVLDQLFPHAPASDKLQISNHISAFLLQSGHNGDDSDLKAYFQLLDRNLWIDIDAVIPCAVSLLKKRDRFSLELRDSIGHLFVDEFQDINECQYELVEQLTSSASVFVIGDPDQAIYGFRGSNPRWFHSFIHKHKPEQHRLVQNYRSGNTIVRASEQVIQCNGNRNDTGLVMIPKKQRSGTIYHHQCVTPRDEAVFITDQIEMLVGGTSHREIEKFTGLLFEHISFKDIGILYRTSRQAEIIAGLLAERGIPFQLVDLKAFYTKGSCRLLYYWMLFLAGLADGGQQLFLFAKEEGIGSKTIQPLLQLHCIQDEKAFSLETLDCHQFRASSLRKGLKAFQAVYRQVYSIAAEDSVESALESLLEYYQLDRNDSDILRLRQLAVTFGDSTASFARYLKKFSDSIIYDQRAEVITLSTLHAAKGLEFKVVFLVGVEDKLLPLALRHPVDEQQMHDHIEEERRLFYVGMTRAIDMLYFTWCCSRVGGGLNDQFRSRFLEEISTDYLVKPPVQKMKSMKENLAHKQLSLF